MTPSRTPKPSIEPSDTSETVQLLVSDAGNRSAISGMLEEKFEVNTSQTGTDADLYLVEDHLLPEYQDVLREQIEQDHPVFCPVVLIRRESTTLQQGRGDLTATDGPVGFDDVVDAPISPGTLIRRLDSLLVRRQQSRKLVQQVSTLEEREQRLRLFEHGVESTGNAIVMTDPGGTIEYANPALESIAGYAEDDVLGESPQILLPEGTGEEFDEEFWRTLPDQGEWEGDIVIEHKESRRVVVNATATALRDGKNEIRGFVIVLSDITERIQREQDLEDTKEELDLLQQILTRYLRHNLRNDLNVIQGNAQMLVEDETLSPQQITSAETIIRSAEDLVEKSESARAYSRLLERDTELSPFDLSEITTSVVQNVRESFPDVNFEIDAPEICDILAQEGIQRALEELIGNAARHNEATDPWVRIQIRDRDGARLVIEDNGPGIPDLERKALEKGTETQLTHSQGVGLWLSKWIIEGVEGQLSVELTDTGTRVAVDFPPIADVGSTSEEVSTLKERERRLQTITDRMTDAIIEIDADMDITRLDDRAEEIFDREGEAVTGQSFWSVFSDLQDTQFETIVRNTMESRSATSVEQYYATIDAWLEFHVYPEFGGGLSFYTRDVTERKERERQAMEMKERYLTLLEAAPDSVVVGDAETGKIIEVSDAAEGLFEMPSDEIVGLHYSDIHPPDQAEYYRELFEEFAQSGGTKRRLSDDSPIHIVTANGDHIPVEISAETVPLPDGPVLYGIFRDISEQVERERQIEREKARFEGVFEDSFDAMVIADDDGRFIEVNESATDLFGVSEDELLGRLIAEFAPEDFNFAEAWQEFQESEKERGTFPLVRADGEERFVEFAATRNVVPGQHLSILRDVTERNKEERKREQIIDRVTDAIVEVGSDWRFTHVNKQAADLYGMDEEYLLGRNFWNVFEDAKGTTFEEEYRDVMDSREPTSFVEYFSQLDGWFDIKAYPKDDGGIAFYFVEVTEQYKRERELAEKTRQLEAIVQNTEEPIYIKDTAGYYQFINESGAAVFDISAEDVINKHDKELFDAESAADIRREDEKVMKSGEALRKETVRYIDGEQHVFLDAKYPHRDEAGEVIGIIGISPDITERKEQEWELRRQRDRLDEFASVVSHDLRNPLNVTQGRIELAQEEYDSDHLEAAANGVERSLELIEKLLALARGGQEIGELEPVDMGNVVQTCWESVETATATVVANLEITIRADRTRLRQLLENLFRNAVEHGGEEVTIRVGSISEGFYVEDDGSGLPADEREDVFELGFSENQEGSGFGLSIVKQIVDAHGWDVRIVDGSEGGARFEITGVEFIAE